MSEKAKMSIIEKDINAIKQKVFETHSQKNNAEGASTNTTKDESAQIFDQEATESENEKISKVSKFIEIVKNNDDFVCKEIKQSTFRDIDNLSLQNVSDQDFIDFSVIIDYLCIVAIFTLLTKQKYYKDFINKKLEHEHLVVLYRAACVIDIMHNHNIEAIICRLENTNMVCICVFWIFFLHQKKCIYFFKIIIIGNCLSKNYKSDRN